MFAVSKKNGGYLWVLLFISQGLFAQNAFNKPLDTRINVLFGLNQPLLVKGFNIEGNLFYKRLVVDYSHGISLNFEGPSVVGAAAEQQLAFHLPYSTGFGVGYRITDWLNVRVEPKWHRYEVYHGGDPQNNDYLIQAYNTFSLGLGAYVNWRPFKKMNNALSGIMLAPSVRYWPRVSSSLENNAFSYYNKNTEQQETHQALEVGLGNTPWIVNISVGYSFLLDKKQ
jgi:hypothetical protein